MPVKVSVIPPGNAGVLLTAGKIADYIRVAGPAVRAQAEAIVGTPPGSLFEQAATIYHWVQSHLRYVRDGEATDAHPLERGEEGIRTPDYLLRGIRTYGIDEGDCDDYVILMGALMRSLGIPLWIVLTSARPDREYDHIFLRVETDLGPVYADAITGQPFGWHLPPERATLWTEIPV